jgi:hypothetical protein
MNRSVIGRPDRYGYAALSGLATAVAMALVAVGRHGIFLALTIVVGLLGVLLCVVSLVKRWKHTEGD